MKRNTRKLETARIGFLQPLQGTAIREHKRSTETREELNVLNTASVDED